MGLASALSRPVNQDWLWGRTGFTLLFRPPSPSPPSPLAKEKGLLHDKVVPISQKKRKTNRIGGKESHWDPWIPYRLQPSWKGWTFKIKGRLKGYPSIPVTVEDAYRALSGCFHLRDLTSENPVRFKLISIAQYSVADDPIKLRMMKLARRKRKPDLNNGKRNTVQAEIAEYPPLQHQQVQSVNMHKNTLGVVRKNQHATTSCSGGDY